MLTEENGLLGAAAPCLTEKPGSVASWHNGMREKNPAWHCCSVSRFDRHTAPLLSGWIHHWSHQGACAAVCPAVLQSCGTTPNTTCAAWPPRHLASCCVWRPASPCARACAPCWLSTQVCVWQGQYVVLPAGTCCAGQAGCDTCRGLSCCCTNEMCAWWQGPKPRLHDNLADAKQHTACALAPSLPIPVALSTVFGLSCRAVNPTPERAHGAGLLVAEAVLGPEHSLHSKAASVLVLLLQEDLLTPQEFGTAAAGGKAAAKAPKGVCVCVCASWCCHSNNAVLQCCIALSLAQHSWPDWSL